MSLNKGLKKLMAELVDLIGKDEVGEVEVERRTFGGWRIRVSKAGSDMPAFVPVSAGAAPSDSQPGPPEASDDATAGLHAVTSPMVGLFYRSPSPDAQPFVSEGDVVSAGQTVCIIEAMKIMNEIEADAAGRVARILVEDGSPVEYNTPLFLLDPL